LDVEEVIIEDQLALNARTPRVRRTTRQSNNSPQAQDNDVIHVSDSDAAEQDEVNESLLPQINGPDVAPSSGLSSPLLTPSFSDLPGGADVTMNQASPRRPEIVQSLVVPRDDLSASADRIWSQADPKFAEFNEHMDIDISSHPPRGSDQEIDELEGDSDGGQHTNLAQHSFRSTSVVQSDLGGFDPDPLPDPEQQSPPDTPGDIDDTLRGMSLDSKRAEQEQPPTSMVKER
jgi:hypothetical protein